MKKTYAYAVAALIAAAFTAMAGQPVVAPKSSDTVPSLQGSFGVDVVSGYTFKGVKVDTSLSTQPYLNLSVPVTLSGLGFDSASVNLGAREFTKAGNVYGSLYRSEVTAGVTLNAGSVSLTPSYHLITSPNGKGNSSQAVELTLGYKDSGLLGPLALNPHASVYYGFQGQSAGGTNGGVYYEVGVAPSLKVSTTTVTLPVNLGLASDNFYAKNERYGYTSIGVATKTPLLKNVSFNTSATYFTTKDALNAGQNNHWQVGAGIGVDF